MTIPDGGLRVGRGTKMDLSQLCWKRSLRDSVTISLGLVTVGIMGVLA